MTNIIHTIYLGNKHNAHDDVFIKDNNIKYIINITLDIPNKYNNITYYNYNIEDSCDDDIQKYFNDITSIINNNKNNNILVHCRVGKSRSATVILAYLMKYENMTLKQSLDFVKSKKNIQPNICFFDNLIKYEYDIYKCNSITLLEYINKSD
jgi:protein-tyrosine phosphatase